MPLWKYDLISHSSSPAFTMRCTAVKARPDISIIIPTYNEEAGIGAALSSLLALRPSPEIIVSDGLSEDGTIDAARQFRHRGVRVLTSGRRGRGPQMNAGAAAARGNILLFLHADVRLPEDALERVSHVMENLKFAGGAFLTCTSGQSGRTVKRLFLRLADIRSRYTTLPYGDQALFVRAAVFQKLGGYAEIPLMEDLEFSRRLRSAGKVARLRREVVVSGRRFESRPLRSAITMNLLPLLFRMGISPWFLARLYGNPR
jgi:rSAM/selenodomain-associated transferase 2